jgi:hypothetical protein
VSVTSVQLPILTLLLCFAASACSESAPPAGESASDAAASAAAAGDTPELRLPVSLNTLMVALVNHAADPIWLAAWRNPQTDKDWRELERLAVQLEVGGALLGVPGTGPMDEEWSSDPAWQAWAEQLRQAGAGAVVAVKARNLDAISSVGDEIVEICEGCHIAFKPAVPTGGEFGELSPTAADFEETAAEAEAGAGPDAPR